MAYSLTQDTEHLPF